MFSYANSKNQVYCIKSKQICTHRIVKQKATSLWQLAFGVYGAMA